MLLLQSFLKILEANVAFQVVDLGSFLHSNKITPLSYSLRLLSPEGLSCAGSDSGLPSPTSPTSVPLCV